MPTLILRPPRKYYSVALGLITTKQNANLSGKYYENYWNNITR